MSTLEEGEVVLIPKLGSQRIVFEGQDYFICKESDILGVIE
jgi:co-chaperonin GroES (HSP10)